MRCEQLKSYNKKNPNNLSRFPQLSYSKYHQAGQKVQQRSHFYAKKKNSLLSELAGINFLRCDHFRLRPPPLRRAAGRSSSFHPEWFKGNDSFFFFGNQKSRICEEEKYFETKIKRKSFSMEQWKGKDTDETGIAAEPKDDVLVFQQRSRKKDGLFGNPNPKHVKEPTKQLFV